MEKACRRTSSLEAHEVKKQRYDLSLQLIRLIHKKAIGIVKNTAYLNAM